MDPVVHFEMPASDKKRVAAFYSTVFGWQMNQLGSEMGDYVLAGTVEVDDKQMPKKPGAINGGFFTRTKPDQYPSVVIAVQNLNESMKKVEAAGGKILGGSHKAGEPDDIPDIGLYISFLDSESNRVGMLEPKRM